MSRPLLHSLLKLLVISSSLGLAFRIPECENNTIRVEESQDTPIRCTGLLRQLSMYWALTYDNGTVSTIAECSKYNCSVIDSDFNVTREDTSSTLVIQTNVTQKDGATLTCSKRDNVTHANCKIKVEPAANYSLTPCNTWRNFDIVENLQPEITCTGIPKGHNIYWSITDPISQNETTIAECAKSDSAFQLCTDTAHGFNVSRESDNSSTLTFLNASLITSGSTLKCSQRSNYNNVTCKLFLVPAYRIPACSGDVITVSDMQGTPVVCEGLHPKQSMYWTLTYGNGNVSTIATCKFCEATCPPCSTDSDFNVTREDNSSTLVIQTNVRQKDGATLTCSKRDNVTSATCRIRVVSPQTNSQTSSRLPVAAVAGGVVGCTFIVAVVVFIAVIIKHRRSSKGEPKGRQNLMHQISEFEEYPNPNYYSVSDAELPIHDTTVATSPTPSANHSSDAQSERADNPESHVYAQVNKDRKKGREPLTSAGQPGEASQGEQLDKGDVGCAVPVKKSNSSTNEYVNTAESPALGKDQDDLASKNSNYTNVPSTGENTYYNTASTEGQAEYRNVQTTQNAAPGKTAESDDEYHRLRFARSSQQGENSTYNHLTEL